MAAPSCDVDDLAEAAKCFGCIPNPEEVIIYLLCFWAENLRPE